jgi:hypothetical protein
MPEDIPGGDMSSCMNIMQEDGHDEESAAQICEALSQEAKADHGDPDALMDALERGAGLIADVGVDLVSGVDVPAVDSKWVMTKSGGGRRGHDYRATTPVLLAKEDDPEKRITYAAAMIPREPDKEGDVVATPTVEKAAHDFLKSDGGVDTDHSLIDGEGQPVESWVLKEERTFDLPSGGTETYGAGTWMLGIEWGPDAWKRIQDGDLTGLSIYGMADHVALGKRASGPDGGGCLEVARWAHERRQVAKDVTVPFADESVVQILYASRNVAAKAAERFGFSGDPEDITHEHEYDGDPHYMPAPTHEEYVEAYNEFAEADGFGPMDGGEIVTAETAKDEEDPCWDGYTMVGLDENGNPNCVPDDEVDDVEFDSVETREASITVTHKESRPESDGMAPDATDDGGDADGGETEDGPTLKDLHEQVAELQESVTAKQDEQEALAMLADSHGMDPGDVSDLLTLVEGKDMEAVLDAIDSIEAAAAPEDKENDGMGDDEDDEEEDKSVEKRTEEANLAKGSDATATAQKGVTDDGAATSGTPSYKALAEQAEAEE